MRCQVLHQGGKNGPDRFNSRSKDLKGKFRFICLESELWLRREEEQSLEAGRVRRLDFILNKMGTTGRL